MFRNADQCGDLSDHVGQKAEIVLFSGIRVVRVFVDRNSGDQKIDPQITRITRILSFFSSYGEPMNYAETIDDTSILYFLILL